MSLKTTKCIPLALLVLFILSTVCPSCSKSGVAYSAFLPIPQTGWSQGDTLNYYPYPSVGEGEYRLSFWVRHTNFYPYSNLWLFVQTTQADGQSQRDTLQLTLADSYGQWNGSGWGSLYETEQRIDLPFTLAADTLQRITIAHGMLDNPLSGITEMGVRLRKATE